MKPFLLYIQYFTGFFGIVAALFLLKYDTLFLKSSLLIAVWSCFFVSMYLNPPKKKSFLTITLLILVGSTICFFVPLFFQQIISSFLLVSLFIYYLYQFIQYKIKKNAI